MGWVVLTKTCYISLKLILNLCYVKVSPRVSYKLIIVNQDGGCSPNVLTSLPRTVTQISYNDDHEERCFFSHGRYSSETVERCVG